MNINYFLKQSARKIIFLVVVIPVIIQLILVNLTQIVLDKRLYYFLFFIFWLLSIPYFYWLNTAVKFLYYYSNKDFINKLITFKITLLVNIIVILNFIFFIAYIFSFVSKGGNPSIDIIGFMLFIQFIGVLSYTINSYFVCKIIVTLDLNRKVSFSDVVGNLAIFSIPIVAIWVVQNKVKKIQSANSSKQSR